jgi:hypothetical protein
MEPAAIRAPSLEVNAWMAMHMKDIMVKKSVPRMATEERRAARMNRNVMMAQVQSMRPRAWLSSSVTTPSTV